MKIITKTILITLTLLVSLSIKTVAATNSNTHHEKKAQYSKYLFASTMHFLMMVSNTPR